jgi:hypothetical protein
MSAGLYRLRAKDCTENAEIETDPEKRANWLSLAGKWQRLALEVEMRQLKLWGVRELPEEVSVSHVQEFPFAVGALRQH